MEFGLLAASAAEWFGAKVVFLSPDGGAVKSTAGLTAGVDRAADPAANRDLDAIAVIGSDQWALDDAPDIAPLLRQVAQRGGVVGGICAGTLSLARAGLFETVRHTSNGPAWIRQHLPDYAGYRHYQDVAHAVADAKIVSAPGSAPGTFAVEFLRALYPEQGETVDGMRTMFAKEHAS